MTLIYSDNGAVYTLSDMFLIWALTEEYTRGRFFDFVLDVLNEISCYKNDMVHVCLTRAECGRVAMRIRAKDRPHVAREGARNVGNEGAREGAPSREGASAREGQGGKPLGEGAREGASAYEGVRTAREDNGETAQGAPSRISSEVDLFRDFSTTTKA